MKLTLEQLKNYVKGVVTKDKQGVAWKKTTDNFPKLLDKIGKIATLDGVYSRKLTDMDGEELPLGKTIEEYFIDLTLPEVYSDIATEGAKNDKPNLPTVEDVAYSYTLGRTKIKTTKPYNDYERACNNAEDAVRLSAKIIENLDNSYELEVFGMKKQLLANTIAKAEAATNANYLVESIEKPGDTTDNTVAGEKFIKRIKELIEDASFANEHNNLGDYLVGAAPSLKLYVNKKVLPSLEVDTLAGAFHDERLAIPASVEVVDDFGDDASGAFAVLADTRMMKLHPTYKAIRTHDNADGDFVNYVLHAEHTGFISKSTFVHVFKKAE